MKNRTGQGFTVSSTLAIAVTSVVWLCAVAGCAASPGQATPGETLAESLDHVFSAGVLVERKIAWLDDEQLRTARERAGPGVELSSPMVTYHEVTSGGVPVGRVFLDTHAVRTSTQTLLVVVSPKGAILSIRVVRSMASRQWLDSFRGARLNPGLALGASVDAVAGATLTSRAVVHAVRRVLALHSVISG